MAAAVFQHQWIRALDRTTRESLGAAGKLSLKYLDTNAASPSTAHHLWPREGCTSRKRVAASYRAKMVSGSYILQATRARFNQNRVIPTCPMCKSAPEDLPHFVLACPSLSTPRDKLLPRIKRLATDLGMYLPQDQDTLCKSLLNSANPESCCACSGRSRVSKHPIKCKCSRLNDMISQLCLDLHNGRTQALSQTPS